jgi:hypothetical protein
VEIQHAYVRHFYCVSVNYFVQDLRRGEAPVDYFEKLGSRIGWVKPIYVSNDRFVSYPLFLKAF